MSPHGRLPIASLASVRPQSRPAAAAFSPRFSPPPAYPPPPSSCRCHGGAGRTGQKMASSPGIPTATVESRPRPTESARCRKSARQTWMSAPGPAKSDSSGTRDGTTNTFLFMSSRQPGAEKRPAKSLAIVISFTTELVRAFTNCTPASAGISVLDFKECQPMHRIDGRTGTFTANANRIAHLRGRNGFINFPFSP